MATIYTSTHTQTEIDNGVDNAICYGTSSTGASTAQKAVTVSTGAFSLSAGRKIVVKFSNANTASTPTLKVGTNSAKNIYSKGSQITTGSNKALIAGVCEFIYDGTQFHLIGSYIDTTYSSQSASSGGTTVSLCTTGEKYTWNNKGSYSKPSGGIPKTDLSSAVQTSLGLADTALQSGSDGLYKFYKVSNVTPSTPGTVTLSTNKCFLFIQYPWSGVSSIVTFPDDPSRTPLEVAGTLLSSVNGPAVTLSNKILTISVVSGTWQFNVYEFPHP